MSSKTERVVPVFDWLEANGGVDWPTRLLALTVGLRTEINLGPLVDLRFRKERTVPPSADRLRWLIENAHRLIPRDGRRWTALRHRTVAHSGREDALERLAQGRRKGVPKKLRLEGSTACDCLIECERAFVWIEGKLNDWICPNTKWDSARDQLARNLEAVHLLATQAGKNYCLIICHERELKHHEEQLISGYRNGTWQGGWPHLDDTVRRHMAARIGLATWHSIASEWQELRDLPELHNLTAYHSPLLD